ncbi:MAG: hypothetical protein U0625_06665 [Phycisphaerales bacterium]
MATSTGHRWRFTRSGGSDQPRLETAEDFANLEHLDLKLWAALACPVKGLEFDERTLALIDTDNDGRVRAPEIIAAVQWCEDHLRDLAALKEGTDALPLSQINDQTPSGKAILASAKQILRDLGKPDATAITLADAADTAKIFAGTRFNGDGIVPADAAEDDATRRAIADVIACMGAVADRSGKPGVDQAKLDAFFAQCAAFDAWATAAESDPSLRALGDSTAAALEALQAVRAKVDDYFARCRMAAFDPRALAAVNRQEADYLAIAAKDLSVTAAEVAGFPIAKVEAGRALPLESGLNPAWEGRIAAMRTLLVAPLLGAQVRELTEAQWRELCGKLAAYEAWLTGKPAVAVEPLGIARVRELLRGGAQQAIAALIAQDLALQTEANTICEVERLVRYYRDLNQLLNNFVNFSDFYSRRRRASFQVGTLYLDGRACDLCVRVDDAGKHAALAGMSKAYLAYCDCTRPSGEKLSVAAAFTGGDADFLMVGRNGIFYDRKGRDWDATITKVVENPISIRQAFWAPYKKLVRMIEEQAAKRAAAKEAENDAQLAAAANATVNADKAAPAGATPTEKKIDVGTVAALGVAFGALGTLMVAVVSGITGLFELPFWQAVIVVGGILVLISTPSMVVAWLKLRQRNLGPILDANGWAINGRMMLNVPFGGSLTSVAAVPGGSLAAAADPFGEKRSPWPRLVLAVVIVCFLFSLLNHFELIGRGLVAAGVEESNLPAFILKPGDAQRLAEARRQAELKAAAEKAAEKK